MQTLSTLYALTRSINDAWNANESVDWGEAEQLVRQVKSIPHEMLTAMPDIAGIIHYADANTDWDSGEVARWPDVICEAIEGAEKQYSYRMDGDNWEVYSIALTGEEEWKATVETESLAERLVNVLSGA